MAKKTRYRSAVGKTKTKRRKAKGTLRAKSKTIRRKRARKIRPKIAAKKVAGKMKSAFHTISDTIKETDRLRNKLESPGTSQTE